MSSQRIDVHHHLFRPEYMAAVERAGLKEAGGGGIAFPDWSSASSIEVMNRHGTGVAIVSIASPGVYLGDGNVARDLARLCYEYAAELVRDHRTRFGFFASVPLPNVENAIVETGLQYPEVRWYRIAR